MVVVGQQPVVVIIYSYIDVNWNVFLFCSTFLAVSLHLFLFPLSGHELVYGQVLYGHPHPYARSAYSPGTAYEPFYPAKPIPFNPFISTYRQTWAPVGHPPNREAYPSVQHHQPYPQPQPQYHHHQDSYASAYTPVLVYNQAPVHNQAPVQYSPAPYSPPPPPAPYVPQPAAPAYSPSAHPAPYSPPAPYHPPPPPAPYSPPPVASYNPSPPAYIPPAPAPYTPPAPAPYTPVVPAYIPPAPVPHSPPPAAPVYPEKPAEPIYVDKAPEVVPAAPYEEPVAPAAPADASYQDPVLTETAAPAPAAGSGNQLDDGYPWTPELVDDEHGQRPIPSILFYPLDSPKTKDVLPAQYRPDADEQQQQRPVELDSLPDQQYIPEVFEEDVGEFGWKL